MRATREARRLDAAGSCHNLREVVSGWVDGRSESIVNRRNNTWSLTGFECFDVAVLVDDNTRRLWLQSGRRSVHGNRSKRRLGNRFRIWSLRWRCSQDLL